jgi:hypothetical protein
MSSLCVGAGEDPGGNYYSAFFHAFLRLSAQDRININIYKKYKSNKNIDYF